MNSEETDNSLAGVQSGCSHAAASAHHRGGGQRQEPRGPAPHHDHPLQTPGLGGHSLQVKLKSTDLESFYSMSNLYLGRFEVLYNNISRIFPTYSNKNICLQEK